MDEHARMVLAMEVATGDTLDCDAPKRTERQYWMRAVISAALYAQGWTDDQIGSQMHRNHATIWCCRNRLAAALEMPRIYPDVVRMRNEFNATYYELFGQRL